MISLDARALLRRLLDDDPEQSQKLEKLFEGRAPVVVTEVVIAEIATLLTSQHYAAGSAEVAAAVESLLKEPNLIVEDRQAVWRALQDFVKASRTMPSYRLLDALALNKARSTAEAYGEKLKGFYTTDPDAPALPGLRKL